MADIDHPSMIATPNCTNSTIATLTCACAAGAVVVSFVLQMDWRFEHVADPSLLENQSVPCVCQHHEHQVRNFAFGKKCFPTAAFSVSFLCWTRSIFASSSRLRISFSFNPCSIILSQFVSSPLFRAEVDGTAAFVFGHVTLRCPWCCQNIVLLCIYHTCFHAIALS